MGAGSGLSTSGASISACRGLQVEALNKAGCDKIYKDTISGTKSQRPGLDHALGNVRHGDTLVL